jgi:hypothetical protein
VAVVHQELFLETEEEEVVVEVEVEADLRRLTRTEVLFRRWESLDPWVGRNLFRSGRKG